MSRWPLTEQERFNQKVNRTETCWLWAGRLNDSGYGVFHKDGKERKAHRVAYERENGPIPAESLLDHTCRVRCCVNPAHLRIVNKKQNAENVVGKYRDVYPVRNKFRVLVTHHGVKHHGGYFDSQDEAIAAARTLRNQLFTHNDSDKEKP